MKMEKKDSIIYFVTQNEHKFNEVLNIFNQEKIKLELKLCKLKTMEIQADSNREVALYKLQSIKDKIDASYFIEDAGFYVDHPLNGFPGVYSSYVFKTIGNKGIINLIDDFKGSKAHFSAIIAFYSRLKDKISLFEGKINGRVSSEIRGNKGFGFDPIFIPDERPDKTFGELTIEEKNKISHRRRALKQLISFLKEKNSY
jgi:XTP/dITP diphosphohydrolase